MGCKLKFAFKCNLTKHLKSHEACRSAHQGGGEAARLMDVGAVGVGVAGLVQQVEGAGKGVPPTSKPAAAGGAGGGVVDEDFESGAGVYAGDVYGVGGW